MFVKKLLFRVNGIRITAAGTVAGFHGIPFLIAWRLRRTVNQMLGQKY
jgi:transcriptional regulator GlxA family with amidase domain